MKPEFHEDYMTDKLDPLASPMHQEFDWNDLYERFGELSDRQITDEQLDRLQEFVRKLFEWVIAIDLNKPNSQMLIGRRFIALAWTLNPGLFNGSSASKLADVLGITRKADLWTLTGQASQHFGVTNRGQSHAWNRGKQTRGKANGSANGKSKAEPKQTVQQNDGIATGKTIAELSVCQ